MCTAVGSFFCPSLGDPTPFTGWFLLWDGLRVLVTLAALYTLAHSLVAAPTVNQHQARRYVALALCCVLVVTINLSRIGQPPTYVLALTVVAMASAVYGTSDR